MVKKKKVVETEINSVVETAGRTKKEVLDGVLAELQNAGGIDASAIVSVEGLLLAERAPSDVDIKIFSALCASVMGAAETALEQMNKGFAEQVIIKGEKGQLFLLPAGQKAVLAGLSKLNSNIGLVLLEMGKAADKISRLL
jgi:uncharacterized protein